MLVFSFVLKHCPKCQVTRTKAHSTSQQRQPSSDLGVAAGDHLAFVLEEALHHRGSQRGIEAVRSFSSLWKLFVVNYAPGGGWHCFFEEWRRTLFFKVLATKEASSAGRLGPVYLHGYIWRTLAGDTLHCGPFAQLRVAGWELRKLHVASGVPGCSKTIAVISNSF